MATFLAQHGCHGACWIGCPRWARNRADYALPAGGANAAVERRRVGCTARSPITFVVVWAFSVQPPSEPGVHRFNAPGSPAIYAACAIGLAWIQSWQGAQTMRVLRRILAMRAAHAGWPGPGLPSCLSAATW
jgi:hypothetical protein